MLFRVLVKPFGSIWKLKKLCNSKHPLLLLKLYRFLYNAYQFEHCSAISYKTSFASIPNLPNGTKQIIISDDVKIGSNCVIFQEVTIQNDTLPDSPLLGSPIIGSNCYIYPGVKIVGGIQIGDNVRIAPNVTITQDIPSNSYVRNGEQIITTLCHNLNHKYHTIYNEKWMYFNNNKPIPITDKNTILKLQKKFHK